MNFANGIWLHNRLWHKPEVGCVIGVGETVDQAGVDAEGGDDLGELRFNIHALIVHLFQVCGKVSITIYPMTKEYLVPLNEIRRELVVVNSRFIATLAPVFGRDEARSFIARIRREFTDASHHVPAYIIGGGNTVAEFCSDDGEPAGTSGKPALAVLRGSGLGDAAVVITRYFGGTLLGTGGLVKAYTESTQMVVSAVERGRVVMVHEVLAAVPYNLLERVRLMVIRNHGEVVEEEFAVDVTMTLQLPVESFDSFRIGLQELSAGRLDAEVIGTKETIAKI